MTPARVTITIAAVAMLLLAVFLLPLPVSRVREIGLIQVHPQFVAQRHVHVPGQLKKLYVPEGAHVTQNQVLAEFTSLELESRILRATTELDLKQKSVIALDRAISDETDPERKGQLQQQRFRAEEGRKKAKDEVEGADREKQKLVLRAPRDGAVIGLP